MTLTSIRTPFGNHLRRRATSLRIFACKTLPTVRRWGIVRIGHMRNEGGMSTAAAPVNRRMNAWSTAALAGGLGAGALDIAYALGSSALKGRDPSNVLRAIASGVLGPDAFAGGVPSAVLGLALHFAMALIFAWIFLWAIGRGLDSLRRYPLMSGPLYGVGVYFVMYQIVVPLSRVPMRDPRPPINFPDLAVHMFLVGLPIALAAFHWLARPGHEQGRA